jgi:hypothetical protein
VNCFAAAKFDNFRLADDPSGNRTDSSEAWESQRLPPATSVFYRISSRSVNRFFLSIRLDSLIDFVAIRGRDLLSNRSLPRTRADAGRRK